MKTPLPAPRPPEGAEIPPWGAPYSENRGNSRKIVRKNGSRAQRQPRPTSAQVDFIAPSNPSAITSGGPTFTF